MKKPLLIIIAAGLMVAACGEPKFETDLYVRHSESELSGCDTVGVSIDHSIEYFTEISGGKKLRDRLNNEIVRIVFGEDYDGMSVDIASERRIEEDTRSYQEEAGANLSEMLSYGQDAPLWFCNWSYMTDGTIWDRYRNYVTYRTYNEEYTGGAHGMNDTRLCILDLKRGVQIYESDIIAEDSIDFVTELIKIEIENMCDEYPDSYYYEGFMWDEVRPNGNCGISEAGIVWAFNPYEIAPYAQGLVEVCVSWDVLRPYLKASFK